jgi:hypothetical protein
MNKTHRMWILAFLVSVLSTGVLAVPAGLEAYWSLDEGSGTVVGDASGNGNSGALMGSIQWAEGVFGSALQFNGVAGEHVTMDSYIGVTGSDDRTALGWIKTAGTSDFFSWGTNATGQKWNIRIEGQGRLRTEQSGGYLVATTPLNDDEWHHFASVFSGTTSLDVTHYLDGEPEEVSASSEVAVDTAAREVWLGEAHHGRPLTGLLDEVAIFSRALTQAEIQEVLAGIGTAAVAVKPVPAHEAGDVPRDGVVLQWTPGDFAETHDLYLGTSFDDVNDASLTDPLGAAVYDGLDVNAFTLERLLFDTTYYWRVDEVNAPADPGTLKGNVWQFTVEPEALEVLSVTATASSVGSETEGPENTVNGAGLLNGTHTTDGSAMWVSSGSEPGGAGIEFDLGRVQVLAHMQVWNHNLDSELLLGFGFKDTRIETSLDGETWTELKSLELAQATSNNDYIGEEVALDGTAARHVRLTALSNWSSLGIQQYGLSEVRFYALPVQAREPSPPIDAMGVSVQETLRWRAGREAAQHEVLLGTEPDALATEWVDDPRFETSLLLEQTYYWQVNEVNEAGTLPVWPGELWSFTTASYIVIDDFEMYDSKDHFIYASWLDGFDNPSENGSVVGNGDEPETAIVYAGNKSMPLGYGNGGAAVSRATYTLPEAQSANQYGIQTLVLYVHGAADNVVGQLSLEINDQKVADYPGPQTDLQEPQWHTWPVDLAASGVTSIESLALVVAGGQGKLMIDEIRLYAKAGQTVTPVEPSDDGLVAHYKFEGDTQDAVGAHHGTAVDNPTYAQGKDGQALSLSVGPYVTVPYTESLAMNTFTVSAWVKLTDPVGIRGILGTRFNGNFTFDVKVNQGVVHGDIGDGTGWLSTALDINADIGADQWHHIVYVIDDDTDTASLYLNGLPGGQVTFDGTPLFMQSGQELRIGVSAGTEYMHGDIDEVRLYNRALSAAEAAGLSGRTEVIYQPF